jgi:hypothetical protein
MTGADRIARVAWIAAGLGAALCVLGLALAPTRLGLAWLSAIVFWIGLPFGALALCLAHDLTGGAWGEALQAPLRAAIMTLPAPSLALLPILVTLSDLYPWAAREGGNGHFYLVPSFFVARSLLYLALWNGLAALRLRRATPRLSAIGLIVLVVTGTFAAIDWSMSLEAPWSSSVYGLLITTEWVLTGLATVIVIAVWPGLSGARVELGVKDGSLGKLLLAVLLCTAYLAFMQFLIVWEENLTHEIPWYLRRLHTGWAAIAGIIVALEFVVPFLLLLSRGLKRRPAPLGVIAALILAGRLIQTWWLVLPARPGTVIDWLDVAAILTLGGAMLAMLAVRRSDPTMARLSHG